MTAVLTRLTKACPTALSGLGAAALIVLACAGPAAAAVSATPLPTPTFNGSVYAVAVSGNVVYVGGSFTAAIVRGKQVARQRLAAVDVSTGALLDWAPAADNVVRAVAVAGQHVWVGGDFQNVNGQVRDSLAKVSATGSGALDPASYRISGGTPRALGVGHGRLYLAGLFTAVNGVTRGNVAAVDLASGALSGWAPRTDDLVTSLAVTDNRVYLAGSFHRTNDISSTGRLIAVRADGATVDLGFRPQPQAIVHAMSATADRVYAALGGQGGRAVAYSTGGSAEWTLTTDGDVQAIAALGGSVYLGGHFDNVCRSTRTGDHGSCVDGALPRVKLAATDLDGDLLPWAPTANGIRGVLAMTASAGPGVVVAGGEFTTIDGVAQKRFAVFD